MKDIVFTMYRILSANTSLIIPAFYYVDQPITWSMKKEHTKFGKTNPSVSFEQEVTKILAAQANIKCKVILEGS